LRLRLKALDIARAPRALRSLPLLVLAALSAGPAAAAAPASGPRLEALAGGTPAHPSGAAPTPAPGLGVAVARDEMTFAFAASMRFVLEATAEAPVEDIVLRYTVGGDGPRNRRIPVFTPGRDIRAAHDETLVRGQIPPASEITWWWSLTTAGGAAFETAPRTARYLDERFRWRSADGQEARVWWYGDGQAVADDIARRIREALGELAAIIGSPPDRRIEIVLYRSQDDLRPALVDRGGTYEARLATLGARVAPDILVLDAGSPGEDLYEVLRHELSHVVLHLHLQEPYIDAPLWLDEGLAMYVEGELSPDEQATLDEAVREDALMSLRSLTSFPGDADLVPLAYAESRDIVAFLVEDYGEPKFQALINAIGTGDVTPDQALEGVYGAGASDLYQAYRASHGLAPAATPDPTAVATSRRERARRVGGGERRASPCAALGLVAPALAAAWWGRGGRRRGAAVTR